MRSTPRHRSPHLRDFYNPNQTGSTTETGIQRFRREEAERDKRRQQAAQEEARRRSQHAQGATPKGN